MQPIIGIKNLKKVFKDSDHTQMVALENINLEVMEGEFFVLVGPSGSGKSTLLRIMSGLESDYDGTMMINPSIQKTDVSFVFQQFALLPWLTVHENIELGLIARNMPAKERASIVHNELVQFDLEKFAHARPRDLSGGMRQRVGIARALATNPKIIFMDEPFSELDSFTAAELRKELLAIWEKRKPTIVMVTHIIQEAVQLADRIAVMTSRPGTIEHIETNTMTRPRNERSEEFYRIEDKISSIIRP